MPIKWTADNNQVLLCKIIETSTVSVDVDAIAAKWPDDKGEKPTPRAIREQIFKIRRMTGSNYSMKGGKGPAVVSGGYPSNKTTTPRKAKSTTVVYGDDKLAPSVEATPTKKRGRGRPRKADTIKQEVDSTYQSAQSSPNEPDSPGEIKEMVIKSEEDYQVRPAKKQKTDAATNFEPDDLDELEDGTNGYHGEFTDDFDFE